MNFIHSTVHTPIDYLSYLGSDIAVSFMVLEITSLPVGTLSVITHSVYIGLLMVVDSRCDQVDTAG